MSRLLVKGWADFQHYKDRAPPWIKLHKTLLDNFEFQCLPVASRALAPMLWLLASEQTDGGIDYAPEKLAFRLRQSVADFEDAVKPLILAGFFILERGASDVLAPCKPGAMPETETEAEEKTEIPDEAKASPSSPKATKGRSSVPCPYDAIVEAYHAALPMLPRVKIMDDKRMAAMRKRWAWVLSTKKADGTPRALNGDEAVAWFAVFFERAAANDWLTGRTPSRGEHANWKADLDYLLTDRGLKAVVERTEVAA